MTRQATTPTTPLGKAIREARGKASMETIAANAGVSYAYIARLESGSITTPSPPFLRRIAAALGVPYISLLEAVGYIQPGDLPDHSELEAAARDVAALFGSGAWLEDIEFVNGDGESQHRPVPEESAARVRRLREALGAATVDVG